MITDHLAQRQRVRNIVAVRLLSHENRVRALMSAELYQRLTLYAAHYQLHTLQEELIRFRCLVVDLRQKSFTPTAPTAVGLENGRDRLKRCPKPHQRGL